MTWNEYNTALVPLIKRFGAVYSRDHISKSFYHWKSRPQSELIDFVNRCITFNQPDSLEFKIKPPYHKPYEFVENCSITPGYYESLLAANGVTSIVDLIKKLALK